MTALPFVIRSGKPEDHGLVIESWTMAYSSHPHAQQQQPAYFGEQKALIRSILARPTTELWCAVAPDDEDAIFGYVVSRWEPATVFYVYTKPHSRRMGVARALLGELPEMPCLFTHKPAYPLLKDLPIPKQWTFNYFRNFDSEKNGTEKRT